MKIAFRDSRLSQFATLHLDGEQLQPDSDGEYFVPPGKSIHIRYGGPPSDLGTLLRSLRDIKVDSVAFTPSTITDEHIHELRWSRDTLTFLDVRSSNIGDEHVSRLRPLTRLTHLWLGKNKNITGGSMRHLRGLKELVELRLHTTSIDDDSLLDFLPLPRLKTLEIDHTYITDRSLDILSRCTTLRRIALYGTSWSEQNLETLRSRLPDCHVSRT